MRSHWTRLAFATYVLLGAVICNSSALADSFTENAFDASGPIGFNAGNPWASSTITYSYSNLLDGTLGGNLTPVEIRAAIEEALGLWAGVTPLVFVEQWDSGPPVSESGYSGAGNPQIRLGHHPINDGNGTIAHAWFPGSGGLAGDVHFSSGLTWSISSSGTDLIEVATHEIGHSLGLNHENSVPSIMNSGIQGVFNGLGSGFLFDDDRNGIQSLYGIGVGEVILDGDVNGDGQISGDGTGDPRDDDVSHFLNNWLERNEVNGVLVGTRAMRLRGDLNWDGVVGLRDFSIMKKAFKYHNPAGLAAIEALSVPEPSSLSLMVVLGVSLLAAGRQPGR